MKAFRNLTNFDSAMADFVKQAILMISAIPKDSEDVPGSGQHS